MSTKTKVAVVVSVQGKTPKAYLVPSGATLGSTLRAAGHNPDALRGSVTVNGETADMAKRVKKDDYIAISPKVEGGR